MDYVVTSSFAASWVWRRNFNTESEAKAFAERELERWRCGGTPKLPVFTVHYGPNGATCAVIGTGTR